MADHSSRLDGIAHRLKSAALYAPAQLSVLDNPPWEQAGSRFLILRLSSSREALRSTGHLFLHRLIRRTLGSSAFVDFAFFPSRGDRLELDGAALPYLMGIAAKRTVDEYDAILVSCSYAMELVNLPFLLFKSGIPLRASERRGAPSPTGAWWPPIVLGGSNAFASQGLIFPDGDSFVDGIFFGEGEAGGTDLVDSLFRTRGEETSQRVAAVERATPAFWATGFGPPGGPRKDGSLRSVTQGRASLAKAGETPLLLDGYVLLNSEEASTCRLQISWGCPSFCSFCFEGWERKPYRELPRERVLAAARAIKEESGASTADLYSFNFNAHEDALSLILELNRIFDRVNMMSQRADLLIRVPGMVACELAAEKRSFTVGVEGISARMRSYYCKGLSDEDLRSLMARLAQERVRELKLFYILAGTELEADLLEFSKFCAELRCRVDEEHPGMRVLFSAGYLVRMPFTPLRGEPLILDRRAFAPVETRVREAVEASGFEFRLASEWKEYLADQLLVAGGHGLASGLEAAATSGCCYDNRIEGDLLSPLVAALREAGELDREADGGEGGTELVLKGPLIAAKGEDHVYPLSFGRRREEASFLEARLEGARKGVDAGSCLGDFQGTCYGCAACADGEERAFLLNHRVKSGGQALAARVAALIKDKRRATPVYLDVELPDQLQGAEEEFLSAHLLRTILKRRPDLTERLFRAEEALRSAPLWRERLPRGFTGRCLVALYGVVDAGDPRGCSSLSEEDALAAAGALAAAFGHPATLWRGAGPEEVSGADFLIRFDRTPPEASLARTRKWLAALKVASTERKTPEGRAFDIAPKDRKKRILERVDFSGNELTIVAGRKVDLAPLFPRPEDEAAAAVTITALRFEG